jgi:heptaprenyl diphosphate synthase
MMVALAFVLSYVEHLIPFNFGIPGVKLGLANLVVVLALYTLDLKESFIIAVIRIILTGLTFGGLFSMLYSLAGGLLSFALMAFLSRKKLLGTVGVSISGGIAHNVGQLLVAMAVLETGSVWYYFPVLLLSGAVTGTLIGLVGGLMVARLQKFLARMH